MQSVIMNMSIFAYSNATPVSGYIVWIVYF